MESEYFKIKNISIWMHSLFSSWMLGFLFQGQILFSLSKLYNYDFSFIAFLSGVGMFFGLVFSGFFVKSLNFAKKFFIGSNSFFLLLTILSFFPPSIFWKISVFVSSFLAGACVGAWGFLLKITTPKDERFKAVANMLILSNVLMILLNMLTVYVSVYIGLSFSMIMLLSASVLAFKIPVKTNDTALNMDNEKFSIKKHLTFLYIFIAIITINSGFMYHIVNPQFSHLEWLTSWYWALPYIAAILIMKVLSKKINKEYILYMGIAMMGISFIGFISFDRSILSYIFINTLMLGSFGVYDLFWWTILAEMLDLHNNPAKVLGIGLSANILGILTGGLLCELFSIDSYSSILFALVVVCISFVLLPPLYKYISFLLNDHEYISAFSQAENKASEETAPVNHKFDILTEREAQVAALLLQGKTYKNIGKELFISENTVKYYVKNIYSKFEVNSRAQLIESVMSENK